jgi:putative NADPH-quinone reductase
MKILAINGSHSGDRGYTRFLVDRLLAGAARAGAETEVVDLAALKINQCRVCQKCQAKAEANFDPNHFRPGCVWDGKDDVQGAFLKMAGADLLVFATPIYIFNMTGLMKTFIDRLYAAGISERLSATRSGLMFHFVDKSICSKPFVCLVCCDNFESETPKNAISWFHTFSRFMDAPLVGQLVRNCGSMTGHGKDHEAEARFPRILDVYAAYEKAGCELAMIGRISKRTQRRANREIIPVPAFKLIKRLRLRGLKEKFAARAREMKSGAY